MLKREEELKNKPTNENLPEEKYTADRLVRVWRQYAFQFKDEGQETFYNALVKRDPLIEKNDVLKLFVENQMQVDYIKPLLTKLISFIQNVTAFLQPHIATLAMTPSLSGTTIPSHLPRDVDKTAPICMRKIT